MIDRGRFQAFTQDIGKHRGLILTGQINGNRSFRWPLCHSSRALEGSGPDGRKPGRKGTGPENRPVKGSNRRHGTETGPATGKDRKRKIPPAPPPAAVLERGKRRAVGVWGECRPCHLIIFFPTGTAKAASAVGAHARYEAASCGGPKFNPLTRIRWQVVVEDGVSFRRTCRQVLLLLPEL